MPAQQGRYWLLTIPHHHFLPYLPPNANYIRGQLESGGTTGYLHWQLVVAFKQHVRLAAVKSTFGNECHAELSRSSAANEYVFKDDTAIPNTRFELGKPPFKRNSKTDWDAIKDLAKRRRLDDVPGDVFIRYARYELYALLYPNNTNPYPKP